ncbi:hypothetical protein BSFA1_81220 (plasmid) [Burkholderia sp. SFA1]|nr:hypothetical protein BYI23_E002150 [Burkholderia sp. YI23]BBQ02994.1 hypothetical protein BSFA1_81220 [Burkholderia sp. SFA1]
MALVSWKSTYRAEADFLVLSGPLAGETISVRFLTADYYAQDYRDSRAVWRCDWETYAREVMTSVGKVRRRGGRDVPEDIVAAVNAYFDDFRKLDIGLLASFQGATYDPQRGWLAH